MSNDAEDLPVLHVDMDAFYVEVERQRDPSLVGKAVVVGGSSDRGVVASASYEARMRGVRSAMPSAQARKLCPDAVFVSAHFSQYRAASQAVHRVFHSITPLVEPIALDEAFLDVSGAHLLFGSSEEIAWRIRHDILETVGLDCSVGVASNKLLAKLASVAAKPRATPRGIQAGAGVRVVNGADARSFLHGHPVAALWGVGAATLRRLQGIGVASVGDLSRVSEASLVQLLGHAHGRHLAMLSHGVDDRPVVPEREAKSISHEETFEVDVTDIARMRSEIVRLADGVASRLRRAGLACRTVQLKVRSPELRSVSRSQTLTESTDVGKVIADTAVALLDRLDTSGGVRLIGVAATGLAPPGPEQLELLHSLEEVGAPDDLVVPWGRVSAAMDEIRARFGTEAIAPGARSRRSEHSEQGGGPGERRWGPDRSI